MIDHPSPNFDSLPPGAAIDMLVLHYTGMRDAAGALARLCDPAAKVSAQYLIDEDGAVLRLVDEGCRAWHAGVSRWRGSGGVNGRSVGIELVNPGHEFGYRPFAEAQMGALDALARRIVAEHAIPARNVVGHSDVAPGRKSDPGELFGWPRLAAAGIGLWPGEAPIADIRPGDAASLLEAYGYDTRDLGLAVEAFQRHFRPARIDGRMDAETLDRLAALHSLLEPRREA